MSVRLLPHAVLRASERSPDAIAFCDPQGAVSFEALARQAAQLGSVLKDSGVGRSDRVGILLRKGLKSVTAVYGILQIGAAYVPLDASAPVDRLVAQIRHCGITHLVTDTPLARLVADIAAQVEPLTIAIGSEGRPWSVLDTAPLAPMASGLGDDMAYVMFTSGSTGTPKAIVHSHTSGLAYAEAATRHSNVAPGDRLSLHSALHFDMSTFALFGAPLCGATGVIVPESYTRLPAEVSKLMAEMRITHWYSVPFALSELLARGALENRDLAALRWVIFAGEPMAPEHLRGLMAKLPHVRFSNHYGPAEVNVCTFQDFETPADIPEGGLPIGRAWDIAEALIVDEADAPTVPGDVGELLIRSASRMRGYWSAPEATQRALFARETRPGVVDEFYRTGDLVREGPDGALRYLGRKDRQVQVRGYRVELSEVERTLCEVAEISEASVFAHEGCLMAAVVGRGTLNPTAILAEVARALPPYAVPQSLHALDTFPRTSTDKVDHRAVMAQALHRMSQEDDQNRTGDVDG